MQRSESGVQIEDMKYHLLKEHLKAVEGQRVLGMDANDLGLVFRVKVPPKFKPPTFEKYNGTSCPITHATAYFRKMSVHTEDQGLLIHFFQDSLSGASLEWYMKLEKLMFAVGMVLLGLLSNIISTIWIWHLIALSYKICHKDQNNLSRNTLRSGVSWL